AGPGDPLNPAGFDARRAGVHPAGRTVNQRPRRLDVRIPALGRTPVRVGYLHTEERLPPTDLTHSGHSPAGLADKWLVTDPSTRMFRRSNPSRSAAGCR